MNLLLNKKNIQNKKKLILIIILSFILLISSSCQNPYVARLEVTNVLFLDYIPEEGFKEDIESFTVQVGDQIETSDGLKIRIKEINESMMEFSTSKILAINEDGRYDLDAGRTEFSIEKSQILELNTTTMSSGHSYTFTLDEIKSE